jgi:hypothetical protein
MNMPPFTPFKQEAHDVVLNVRRLLFNDDFFSNVVLASSHPGTSPD